MITLFESSDFDHAILIAYENSAVAKKQSGVSDRTLGIIRQDSASHSTASDQSGGKHFALLGMRCFDPIERTLDFSARTTFVSRQRPTLASTTQWFEMQQESALFVCQDSLAIGRFGKDGCGPNFRTNGGCTIGIK
jgi:hypothetical protein